MIVDAAGLEPARDRALLLFSGGLDSTMAGLLLRDRGVPFMGFTIEYPNRPARERETAARVSAMLGITETITLPFPLGDYRNDRPAWLEHAASGWIPYRNVMFLSIAAHFALIGGCNVIAAGIRIADSTVFTDATASHLAKIEALLGDSGVPRGTTPPRLFLPLIQDDAIMAALMPRHQATIEATWTCWHDGPVPCGQCGPCVDRVTRLANAKRIAGV